MGVIQMFRGLFLISLLTSFVSFAQPATNQPGVTNPNTNVNYQANPAPRRSLAADTGSLVVEPSWWKAGLHNYNIGYEAAAGTGILGQNVIVGGLWFNSNLGLDVFLGYNKGANGSTETVTDSTNVLATPNTRTTTTSYSGTNTGSNITLGANVKYRLVQTDWFQFNIGMMLAFLPGSSGDYQTGSRTETYADVSNTGNKTVTETALGTITSKTSTQIAVGPRLGTEFYIKWFPHLAVGFSTGILTTLTGETTTTTDTTSQSYTVTSGTAGTPTTKTTSHSVATNKLGFRGTTFGIGGTTFSLTGTFSLRYVW